MTPTLILVINTILLITILVIGFRLARAASQYSYWVGDTPRQEKLKWKILKSLIAIIAIGLLAALLNAVFIYN